MNRRELLLGMAGVLLLPEKRVWALDRTMIHRGPILRKGDMIRFELVEYPPLEWGTYTYKIQQSVLGLTDGSPVEYPPLVLKVVRIG